MRNIILICLLFILSSCSKSYIQNINENDLEVIILYKNNSKRIQKDIKVLRFQRDSLYVSYKSNTYEVYPCNSLIIINQ